MKKQFQLILLLSFSVCSYGQIKESQAIDSIYLDIENITLTFITFYNLVLKNAVTLDLIKNLKHEKIFSTIISYFFYSLFVWTN